MDENLSVDMNALLSEEDESPEEEEEEESTFHREIILQDNYSDGEGSDIEVDYEDGNHLLGEGPTDDTNHGKAVGQINPLAYGNERRVTFASEYSGMSANDPPENERAQKHVNFAVNPVMIPPNISHPPAFGETQKVSLLSVLPSSILGNAVAMSKYLSEYVSGQADLERQILSIKDPAKRKTFSEEIFPELMLTNAFRTLDTTQVAIEKASALAAKYANPPGALILLMHDVFLSIPTNTSITRLGIFYVYNHLIHKFGKSSSRDNGSFLEIGLNRFCIPAIMHSNRIKCTNTVHILTCINVWRHRQIYSSTVCDQLEAMISEKTSGEGNRIESHIDTNTYTVNSEVGSVRTLKHIFNMPMVDSSFEEAIKDFDYEGIIDTTNPKRDHILAEALAQGKYESFDYASRLSGQELILLHSGYLDLAALIEEGNRQFDILKQEMEEIKVNIDGT